MPQEASSDQEVDDPDVEAFAEIDPTGRYGRYKEVLGKGAFKKVYRGFDEWEGIEVAWNQVKVSEIVRSSEDLERLYSEVHLLKTLKHKNIIKFYSSWVDTRHEHINFITEIFTSGTLRQYRKKHKRVDLRALKKWSRQILEGLVYLHSHDPPIIHRDLKCDNIFVNGNHGEVKIGDLGFAAILRHANAAHSVIGTPEFMAPELYEEEYNELVDIYAFGMCVLELVSFEYPYSECSNAAQIYKKVTSGVKPASLAKVKDSSVRAFIEKCIANVCERQSARQLLSDPFLISNEDPDSIGRSLPINPVGSAAGVSNECEHGSRTSYNRDPEPSKEYKVEGQRKDVNTIYVKLKITNSAGNSRTILFPFDTEADTSIAVASEMVQELDLTDQDVTIIADRIDSEIRSHIPDWSPRESYAHESGFDSQTPSELKDDSSPLPTASVSLGGSLIFEQLPSGRKFWLDSPKVAGGNAPFTSKPSPLNPIRTELGRPVDQVREDKGRTSSSPEDKNLPDDASAHVDPDEKLDDENDMLNIGDNILEDDKPLPDEVFSLQEPAMTSSCEEKISGISETLPATSQSDKHSEVLGCSGAENDVALGCIESEEVRTVANKLEQLLQQQQKELEELKWVHELAVSDLLKQLPHKVRCKVFKLCRYKIPDHRMHCESHLYAEDPAGPCSFLLSAEASKSQVKNISESSSSSSAGASLSYMKTSTDSPTVSRNIHLRKVKNPSLGAEGFVVGPITREKLNNMRGSRPDMGIAIILRDDSEKS